MSVSTRAAPCLSLREPASTEPLVRNEQIAVHNRAFAGISPSGVVRAALAEVQPGDYVAFLSYLPADHLVEDLPARGHLERERQPTEGRQ